ncbi:hypothetical protein VCX44_23045, partial [Aeromonas caviae]
HAFPGVGFCLGEGQEIDWIGHTEYSETRIEQLDHIFNLIGITVCLGESNVGGVEVGEGRIFPARRGSCGLAEKSAAGDHGCPDPYAVIGAVGSMGSFQVTG